MENCMTELELYHKNIALKKQVEQQSKILYRVLGKCFYYSTHNTHIPPYSHPDKFNHLEHIITSHLRSVGNKETKISWHLQKLADSFLAYQVKRAQSTQMLSILYKYHEHLSELRMKTIEKETELYYRRKSLYQCFEDEYSNCMPNPERIEGILYNEIQRENIINQCLNLWRGVNQLKKSELALKQIRESQRMKGNNKENQLILQDRQQEQQMQDQESSEEKQQKNLSLLKSVDNVQKNQKNNEIMETPICLPYRNMKKAKIQFEQTTSAELKMLGSSKSIRNWGGKRDERDERRKMPEFKQMSKRDFELFRLYYNKIERLNSDYQQCIQQYKNYIGVYKILFQENLNLVSKVTRSYQLKVKKMSKIKYFPNYFDHTIQNQSQQFEDYFSYDPNIQNGGGQVLDQGLWGSPQKDPGWDPPQTSRILESKQNIVVQLQDKWQDQRVSFGSRQVDGKRLRFNCKEKENMAQFRSESPKEPLNNLQ